MPNNYIVKADFKKYTGEVKGYKKVHEQFKDNLKKVDWQKTKDDQIRSTEIKNNKGNFYLYLSRKHNKIINNHYFRK